MSNNNQTIPDSEQFRAWLIVALPLISSNAYRIAKDAGVAVNACRKFICGEQGDIRLTTAEKVHTEIKRQATAMGVTLPEISQVSETLRAAE